MSDLPPKGWVNNLRNGLKRGKAEPLKKSRDFSLPNQLFLFMTIFSQAFFALVSGHFMSLSFLTAWHNLSFFG